MKISDKGFITIPRALIASSNWQEKRCFTIIEAYIDLQLMAYYGRTPTVHKIILLSGKTFLSKIN